MIRLFTLLCLIASSFGAVNAPPWFGAKGNTFGWGAGTVGGGGGGGSFAPTDLANLYAWYDFSDASTLFTDSGLTTPVSADGDKIGGVNDKGSGNHDAVMATSGNRPTYKTNIKNGKSVARLNGSNEEFDVSYGALGARSVFIVVKSASTSNGAYETLLTSGGAGGLFFRVTVGDGTFVCDAYASGDHDSASSPVNTFVIFSMTNDGTSGVNDDAYKNGTSFFNGALADSITYDSLGGHGGEYLNGDICEVIVYSDLKNSTEHGQVITYLSAKWAVP